MNESKNPQRCRNGTQKTLVTPHENIPENVGDLKRQEIPIDLDKVPGKPVKLNESINSFGLQEILEGEHEIGNDNDVELLETLFALALVVEEGDLIANVLEGQKISVDHENKSFGFRWWSGGQFEDLLETFGSEMGEVS
jgi:hypothetical protein